MKAYQFPARVAGGTIQIPNAVSGLLRDDETVQIIVLARESQDAEEDSDWAQWTAQQFLAGYDATDAAYDRV
jgi:hypothetical protein